MDKQAFKAAIADVIALIDELKGGARLVLDDCELYEVDNIAYAQSRYNEILARYDFTPPVRFYKRNDDEVVRYSRPIFMFGCDYYKVGLNVGWQYVKPNDSGVTRFASRYLSENASDFGFKVIIKDADTYEYTGVLPDNARIIRMTGKSHVVFGFSQGKQVTRKTVGLNGFIEKNADVSLVARRSERSDKIDLSNADLIIANEYFIFMR